MHAYGGHSGKLISSTTDAVIVWNVKPIKINAAANITRIYKQ